MGYRFVKHRRYPATVVEEGFYIRLVDASLVRSAARLADCEPSMPNTEEPGGQISREQASRLSVALREEADLLSKLADFFDEPDTDFRWEH